MLLDDLFQTLEKSWCYLQIAAFHAVIAVCWLGFKTPKLKQLLWPVTKNYNPSDITFVCFFLTSVDDFKNSVSMLRWARVWSCPQYRPCRLTSAGRLRDHYTSSPPRIVAWQRGPKLDWCSRWLKWHFKTYTAVNHFFLFGPLHACASTTSMLIFRRSLRRHRSLVKRLVRSFVK